MLNYDETKWNQISLPTEGKECDLTIKMAIITVDIEPWVAALEENFPDDEDFDAT